MGKTTPSSLLTPESLKSIRSTVHQVYTDLAERPQDRSCTGLTHCCHFQRTGRTPFLTLGEALVAASAWRAAGRTTIPAPGPDGACPFLNSGLCTIYTDRPFGCRTHFCAPAGGPLPRPIVRDLIQRLESLDASLGGSGGVNFHAALQSATNKLPKGRR